MVPSLNIFVSFLSSRPKKYADPTEESRFLQYTVIVAAAILLMAGFGLYHFIGENYTICLILVCCLITLLSGWIWLFKGNTQLPVFRLSVFIYSALLLYVMHIDGKEHSYLLWMYTAPLVSFYLLGRREGGIWSALLGVAAVLYFTLPFEEVRQNAFSREFVLRFLTTYALISVFTYFYENFRYRNKLLIVAQNRQLQQEIEVRHKVEQTLKESEARYRAIYEEAAEGILLITHAGNIVHCNPQFTMMFGYTEEDIAGENLYSYFEANNLDRIPPQLEKLKAGESILIERKVRTKKGSYLQCEQSGKRVNDQLIILLYRDITERKNAESAMEEMNRTLRGLANLDGLTQIANRRMFDYTLEHEWRRMMREKKSLGMIIADIDYFKQYNDHYGHQGGDDCLKKVAGVLQAAARRPTDLVARYGGEEFVILLPDTDQAGCELVGEQMRRAISDMEKPHAGSPRYTIVTMSFGVASIFPSSENSADELLLLADKALYQAKEDGRNRVMGCPSSRPF